MAIWGLVRPFRVQKKTLQSAESDNGRRDRNLSLSANWTALDPEGSRFAGAPVTPATSAYIPHARSPNTPPRERINPREDLLGMINGTGSETAVNGSGHVQLRHKHARSEKGGKRLPPNVPQSCHKLLFCKAPMVVLFVW